MNLRLKAVIRAAIAAVIGGLLMWKHPQAGQIVLGVSAVMLCVGMAFPRGLERFAGLVEHVAGVVGAWVMMVPFCVAIFIPARILQLIKGSDPMQREFPCSEDTCWHVCEDEHSSDRFRRQY